jgi:hypothetical protein
MNYVLPILGALCIAVAVAAFKYVKRTAMPTKSSEPDVTDDPHPRSSERKARRPLRDSACRAPFHER